MELANYVAALQTAFADITGSARAYLPHLFGAVALLAGGWLLARLLQRWSARLARRFDDFARRSRVEDTLERVGVRRPLSEVIGRVVFWAVFLFFVAGATEALGLAVLSTWVSGLAYFLPRIVAAILIVLAGLLVGNVVRDAIVAAGITAGLVYGAALAHGVRIVLLLIAVLIAVSELGIDITILTVLLAVLLGTAFGGAALAFGLGAQTAVSNIIAAHYLRQLVRVGQTVRVAGTEGEIEAITPTAVILRSAAGRVIVPAGEFGAATSTLLTGETPR